MKRQSPDEALRTTAGVQEVVVRCRWPNRDEPPDLGDCRYHCFIGGVVGRMISGPLIRIADGRLWATFGNDNLVRYWAQP
jgi:hypothetical protein